ncbi:MULTISPECIES: hypothetical protein [Campylobacter]|uniref:hypothetical protein n=1 Tax=Campylobacter TaxID=194 RepID=UPI000A7C0EE6|nr:MULTISPECIES: hypothetical protein [Campylobacter]
MINISKPELKELEFNSKVEFKKYEERYEIRKDKKDFIKLSKSILQTSKDLFQVAILAGFSIIIFILILHSLQTKTIPFLDSQKGTALAITGVLFGGIFSFFYMGIFSFSRELYKQYFKIPIRVPFIIYVASSIITFITLQKPNILLLISIVIVFIVANGALYFFGREYRISLNKIETFMLQTILIFIMYVSMIIVSIFIIIKSQEVNCIYLGIGHLIIFIFFSLQLCFKDFKSFKFFVLINTIILFLSIMFLNENITSYLKIGNFKVEEMTLSKNKIVKNKLLDNNISFIENEEGLKVKDLYILSDAKDVYYIQSKKEENKKLKKSFLIDKKYVLDKDF